MKKIMLISLLILSPILICAQETSIKANISGLAGIPNFGIETKLGEKTTFQFDVAASFWTINGNPIRFITLFPEFRFYPRVSGYGFFTGVHIGGSKYKLQKWSNYNTDSYQEGYSLFYGVTIGYQFNWNDRLNLELFLGGGNQQGYYKGYKLSTNNRIDGAKKYNKSGEFLPYRGGLMLVYKLKSSKKNKLSKL
ncbi:DUF3575 domain-containing protein [Thalassobellus citreus]|uniref:DUF3575 domain-containing protein n=1 Tax=Thalassobellus citreus TaxID=3367752 RepID=UPI0037B5C029